jgi:putative ABC transport system permease protein
MNKHTPPKLFLRFLRWYCHQEYLEDIEGDLVERFETGLEAHGPKSARWQFKKDVIRLFRPGIIKSITTTQNLNKYDMFKNYAKVGFRNILKYKMFSFINIFGLAVGMSVCLLIILMLADQNQYDQFHANKDRTYRILTAHENGNTTAATTPFSTSEVLQSDYSIIENATTLRRGVGGDAVHEKNFTQMIGYFADPDFFKVFSYELTKGNPSSALSKPNSMVISEEIAHTLFGTSNPLGKTIDFTNRGLDFNEDESSSPIYWGIYTVTGVIPIADYKSHLEFDVLVSSSSLAVLYDENKMRDLSDNWSSYYMTYNYVLLKEGSTQGDLTASLSDLSTTKFSNVEKMKSAYLTPQSLMAITPGPPLNNAPNISLPSVAYYIFAFLALLVLLSACLNYTNLSIARAITRSKEIGIRKVNGAHRKDLIFQFLSESVITTLLALVLANVMLLFVKSAFMDLWVNKYLKFDLSANLSIYLIFFLFTIILGVVAGIFPAFKLSKQKPAAAIKGLNSNKKSGVSLRKVMTVSQFVISLLFIITSIVIHDQFKHFMSFDYGFKKENVLNVNLQSNDFQQVQNAFIGISGIDKVSACDYLPSTGRTENLSLKKPKEDDFDQVIVISGSDTFTEVLDLKIIAGNGLSKEPNAAGSHILVNTAMVTSFGYTTLNDIIGQDFESSDGQFIKVVGVVEDFTFHLLFSGSQQSPIAIQNMPKKFKMINLSLGTENRAETLAAVEAAWNTIDPIHPFQYEFYEDNLASNNQGIFDIVNIVSFIAFLAISIATLGLLGIVVYTTERRTKEVGVRKILGADNKSITFLLSKEFIKLLSISILIAAPLAYFFNNFWLDFMANRVAFGIGSIVLGSIILLVIGMIAIGSQTVKAAISNPVEALKDE